MNIDAVKKGLEPLLLENEGSVGLHLSGGSDSTLLLYILADMGAVFDVVSFDNSFTRKQRQLVDSLIEKFDLRVFSYPPRAMYLVGDGERKVTLVEEFAFPHGQIPFLRDCIQDDRRCVHDADFNGTMQETPPIGYKLSLFGTRRWDWHFTLGKLLKGKIHRHGQFTFYFPLYHESRADVTEGLAFYGTKPPQVDTGTLPLCLLCMNAKERVKCPKTGEMIAPFKWNPTENLSRFRQKFARVGEIK